MFNFLGSIFGKIASAVAAFFVTVGLISAPASVAPQPTQPVEEHFVAEATSTSIIEELAEPEVDVKAELEKLKNQLVEEQNKRKALEKKVVAPRPESGAAKPAPTPVVATPPSVPAAPVVQLLPGQFMTPSGAIVDSTGKVVKPAPLPATPTPSTSSVQATITPATPPPPPPAPVWPPAEGNTVDIKRSVFSVINFNTHLTCDQLLSLPPSSKDLCKLYKDKQSQYIWNIIEDL